MRDSLAGGNGGVMDIPCACMLHCFREQWCSWMLPTSILPTFSRSAMTPWFTGTRDLYAKQGGVET